MNEDIGKFGYHSMQQKTNKTKIMKRTSLRTFKVTFLTSNVFVFYKNLLCRLGNLCLRHKHLGRRTFFVSNVMLMIGSAHERFDEYFYILMYHCRYFVWAKIRIVIIIK